MKSLFASFAVLALLSCGCATQQLRFDPWKGLPPEVLPELKQGIIAVPKAKLMDAVAVTLEHEPYFHWTFDHLDQGNGLLIGAAGLFREVQVRVLEDGLAGTSETAQAKSRMAVSVPRRALKTSAKIYVLRADPSRMTAYEPDAKDISQYNVVAADTELGPDYFYSFTYRVLNDRTQVPFTLHAYDGGELGQAPAQAMSSEPMPVATPTPAAMTPEEPSIAPKEGSAAATTPQATAATTVAPSSAVPLSPAQASTPAPTAIPTAEKVGSPSAPPAHRE